MTIKTRIKSKEQKPALLDVPMDEAGKIANEYLDIIEEIENREKTLKDLSGDLIQAMNRRGSKTMVVRGVVLNIRDIEASQKIQVQKAK